MKKFIVVVCLLFGLLISTNQKVYASEKIVLDDFTSALKTTEYFEDGSYIIYETLEQKNDVAISSNSYYKSGKRKVTNYDSNNNIQWVYTLSAEYWIEEGISATCTKADYATTIYNSSWSFSDGLASYSENKAYGKGKFSYKVWLITTKTETIDIHLACDSYGNLS